MSAAPGDDPTLRRSLARWQRSGSVIGLALVLAFPIYLGVERTRRDEALVSRQQAMSALGGELWAQNCASCHGINGEGVDAPALNSQQFFEGTDPRQIHHLTASGVPGTEMPAWWVWMGGSLTDEQISAIVAYVLSWQESAPDRPDWQTPGGAHMEGEPTDGHAEGEAGGGDAGGDAVPDEPEPPEEVAGPEEVLITITGRGCEPLEIPVPAGERFKLVLANERDDAVSFDAPALDLHPHVEAGQRVEIALRLEAGEYPFECLGSGHGEILGVGQIHAE